MLSMYRTVGKTLIPVENDYNEGVWVHLSRPTEEELNIVASHLDMDRDFLRAALDEEEAARIEADNGQVLILVDIPYVETVDSSYLYATMPLGIVMSETSIVTVCSRETQLIDDFVKGRIRDFDTFKKTRFILQMLFRIASRYLHYLRQIDKASTGVEKQLHRSMKNRELIQMLQLEKSLVFFSTSLKSNESVMEKMLKLGAVKKYPDDNDLLEDVIIENKQAIEMCTIYRDILSSTMDAFASVISNNLNIVMKFLAAVTIILAIPTVIASLWGMNTGVPFQGQAIGFWVVLGLAGTATGLATYFMIKNKML